MRLTCDDMSAPGRIRTCGLLLRRQTLYPLSYGGVVKQTAPMGLHRLAHRGPRSCIGKRFRALTTKTIG